MMFVVLPGCLYWNHVVAVDWCFQPAEEPSIQVQAVKESYAGAPPSGTREYQEQPSRLSQGSYAGTSFSSAFDPDNVALDRSPLYSG